MAGYYLTGRFTPGYVTLEILPEYESSVSENYTEADQNFRPVYFGKKIGKIG